MFKVNFLQKQALKNCETVTFTFRQSSLVYKHSRSCCLHSTIYLCIIQRSQTVEFCLAQVIDTPDITNCEMDAAAMREEVSKWRRLTVPRPDAVILTVRCDIRYTAEEFAIYQQVVKLWGDNSLKEKLVVAFTFGDCQDEPIEEELKTVCPELKIVLRDAGNVYFVFDKVRCCLFVFITAFYFIIL